jgi:Tfp pilus assembly protein PilN
MATLRLDYQRDNRLLPWAGIALLLAVLALLGALAGYGYQLRQHAARLEAELDRAARLTSQTQRAAAPADPQVQRLQAAEVLRANRVLQQLNMPWDALFRAVESSAGNQVVLLALEPDAQKGTLKITAETRNIDTMLAYLRQLNTAKTLSGVALQNHRVQQSDPEQPIRFAVQAVWKAATP